MRNSRPTWCSSPRLTLALGNGAGVSLAPDEVRHVLGLLRAERAEQRAARQDDSWRTDDLYRRAAANPDPRITGIRAYRAADTHKETP